MPRPQKYFACKGHHACGRLLCRRRLNNAGWLATSVKTIASHRRSTLAYLSMAAAPIMAVDGVMRQPLLSLAQLTVLDAEPVKLIQSAGSAGGEKQKLGANAGILGKRLDCGDLSSPAC
jgi:hypothetical protein